MSAFAATQWQATGSKNQLVLGANGQQAILSAENFNQISTIHIPDPGTANSAFILTDSSTANQTINGNLNVTGTVTSNTSGGGGAGLTLSGDLILTNTANRAIRHGTTPVDEQRTLSVFGSDSNGGAAGGNVEVVAGNATTGANTGGDASLVGGESSGGAAGGKVFITGGSGIAGAGNGGEVVINGGGAPSGKTGGRITVTSGAGADLNLTTLGTTGAASGEVNITTGTAIGAASGDINIRPGQSTTSIGGSVLVDAGQGNTAANYGSIQIGANVSASSIVIGTPLMTVAPPTLIYGYFLPGIVLTGDTSLIAGQSGSVLSLVKPAANIVINLPIHSGTPGAFFRVVQRSATVANTAKFTGGAGTMLGNWQYTKSGAFAGDTTTGTAVQYFTFEATSVRGDGAEFVWDGSFWYVRGWTGATNGMSISN